VKDTKTKGVKKPLLGGGLVHRIFQGGRKPLIGTGKRLIGKKFTRKKKKGRVRLESFWSQRGKIEWRSSYLVV